MSGREIHPSSVGARRTMVANRRVNTGPELRLRRRLHAAGLRYRIDAPLLFDRRRRADVVFPRQRIAVFVDGCFWHGCPEHYVAPKANAAFWRQKVEANRARDLDTDLRLKQLGWVVLRVWEHEDVDAALVRRIQELVAVRR